MSRGSTRQAAIVGLFTAGGIIIFVLGLIAVGNLEDGLTRKVSVHTTLSDAKGLTRGAAVWFSGVPVGKVKEMSLVAPEQVEVRMGINPDHAAIIPSDARASIGSDSLIGNTIVVLSGGSEGKGGLAEGSRLASDKGLSTEEIIAEVRATNAQVQDVLADLKVVSEQLAAGQGTAGKLLSDDSLHTQLTDTISELQRTAQNTTEATASLAAFGRSMSREGSLPYQLTHDETVWPSVVESAESLKVTAAALSEATADSTTPIGVLMTSQPGAEDLEGTLANLSEGTESLNDTLDSLQYSWWISRLKRRRERRSGE